MTTFERNSLKVNESLHLTASGVLPATTATLTMERRESSSMSDSKSAETAGSPCGSVPSQDSTSKKPTRPRGVIELLTEMYGIKAHQHEYVEVDVQFSPSASNIFGLARHTLVLERCECGDKRVVELNGEWSLMQVQGITRS